jgi:hypothetical protein
LFAVPVLAEIFADTVQGRVLREIQLQGGAAEKYN